MAYTYSDKKYYQRVIKYLREDIDEYDVHCLLDEVEYIFDFTEAETFTYEKVLPALKELGTWATTAQVADKLYMPDQKRRIQMALIRLVKDGEAESRKEAEDAPTTYKVKEA